MGKQSSCAVIASSARLPGAPQTKMSMQAEAVEDDPLGGSSADPLASSLVDASSSDRRRTADSVLAQWSDLGDSSSPLDKSSELPRRAVQCFDEAANLSLSAPTLGGKAAAPELPPLPAKRESTQIVPPNLPPVPPQSVGRETSAYFLHGEKQIYGQSCTRHLTHNQIGQSRLRRGFLRITNF